MLKSKGQSNTLDERPPTRLRVCESLDQYPHEQVSIFQDQFFHDDYPNRQKGYDLTRTIFR